MYKSEITDLINGADGEHVKIDAENPRVCILGPESERYPQLPTDQIFPFYEIRAAACDMRNKTLFDGT